MNVLSALCDADSSPGMVNFKIHFGHVVQIDAATHRYISDILNIKLTNEFLREIILACK